MSSFASQNSPTQDPLAVLEHALQKSFGGRYSVRTLTHQGPKHVCAIGEDLKTGEAVVLKSVTGLSLAQRVQLEHEHTSLRGVTVRHCEKLVDGAFDDGTAVLVHEPVDGYTLSRVVAERNGMDTRQAIELARQLFTALGVLHGCGIRHLEISPGNLMVHSGGAATLVRRHRHQFSDSDEKERFLSACYQSPEQTGSITRDVGPPADLYSAGAVLFFMLTGQPPFVAHDVGGVLNAQLTSPPPLLDTLGVNAPRALQQVVSRLLATEPGDRYQTSEAVLHDLKAISSQMARGVSQPHVAIGSHDDRATLVEPAFIGRQEELQRFTRCLSRGSSSCILLEGLSGGGKSRMLDEMCQRAIAAEFQVFRGIAKADQNCDAVAMLDGVVASFIGSVQHQPAALEEFVEAFDDELPLLVSIFPALASVFKVSDSGVGQTEFAEQRTQRLMVRFLSALGTSSRPAFIVLDDCQWVDHRAIRMVEHLIRENNESGSGNLLVVLAFRSEEVDEEHPLRELDVAEQIMLPPLSASEVRDLAESMAGTLPEKVLAMVVDVSAGSPFMATAVVRGLYESSAMVAGEAGWEIDPKAFAAWQSSHDAADFLMHRLELLSEGTRRLLKAGAVLGKEFNLAMVANLTGATPANSLQQMTEARKRHMVWAREEAGTATFTHDRIREALLVGIPEDLQRTIHRQAAEYLIESENPDAASVAIHFDRAKQPRLAFSWALEAGEDASRRNLPSEAKQLYKIAAEISDQADRITQFRLHYGLGEAHMLLGEYEAAEENFVASQQVARGTLANARALGRLGEVRRKRGDLESAIDSYQAALNLLGRPVPRSRLQVLLGTLFQTVLQTVTTIFPRLTLHRLQRDPNESERLCISLLGGLSHAYWYARGKTETLWAHLSELNLGEAYNPSLELANAYAEHAPVTGMFGMFRRASRYAEQSFEIRQKRGDAWGMGQSLCYHACALYASSQFEAAIRKGRESVRLLERAGDVWCTHIARFQVAASLLRLGRFRESLAECKINHQSGLSVGDEQTTAVILDLWAQATYGKAPQAFVDTELARSRIDVQASCQVQMAHGINRLREDRIDEAIEAFDEGIRLLRERKLSNCYTLPVYYWRLHALRRKAEQLGGAMSGRARARVLNEALMQGVRAWLAAVPSRNDVPRILRELALVRLMQGCPRQARWLLSAGLRAAERLGTAYDHAETLNVLGKLEAQQSWSGAEEHRAEAQRLLGRFWVDGDAETNGRAGDAPASATLSLVDRFDTLLQVGRRIASALVEKQVYEQTRIAAERLLRCEDCAIVAVDAKRQYPFLSGHCAALDLDLLDKAVEMREAVTEELVNGADSGSQMPSQDRSIICVPILVMGRVQACLYATHSSVRDLFGTVETQLCDFITAIAGASLENARQYDELQSLNLTLEDRVADRTEAAEARAQELAASNAELERTEEQLREAIRDANDANVAKSQFLATMSHEIRTPMNGILGMTDLLKRSPVTPQQENCLKVIKKSGAALLTLLNDILDFSKIEAGKMELEHVEFDVREVIEHSVSLLATSAHQKGLDVICEIDSNVPRNLVGDPGRLRQVLTNLIGNAIKFTSVGEVHIGTRAEEDSLELFVRDTGIGIPVENQQLIFDAFRQSDSSTTRKFGGSGLGLSICRTFVEMMGGDLLLESEVGRGSTFRVRIPADTTGPDQTSLGDDELCGLIAAVVTGHDDARRSRTQLLECLGLSVMQFSSLDDLQQEDVDYFDVVVIDESRLDQWQRMRGGRGRVIVLSQTIRSLDQELVEVTTPPTLNDMSRAVRMSLGMKTEVVRAPEASETEKCSCRILVADDSIVNQEVAAGLLEHAGHSVTVVSNGREAIEAFGEGQFDLILMDIEMPEVDGLEATTTIRAMPGGDLPIIAASAHAAGEKSEACEQAGISAYIAKPFDPSCLLATIDDFVNGGARQVGQQ